MSRDDAYLLDMLLAARQTLQFAAGVTREVFRTDEKTQAAVMHEIQIVGEAARNISESFRHAHPEIPWRTITGMRHRLVHQYFRIIPDKVWDVVEQDLATLIAQLEPLVPPDDDASLRGES